MASYLLLRDNKESGPFALDDLLNFGLKPYDLIWVQGKSAAWRYPSEIEELKPFAPIVEEQPFDRFYKKNSEEEKMEEPPAIKEQYSRYIPPAREENSGYTPKRSVFVTLPGQKQVEIKKETPPVQERPAYAPKPGPAPEPIPAPTISITENPATAEIKYSQPLDEIKEMYVKTLLERKDKHAKKGLLFTIFKKAAVVAGLIILGVIAGFIIRSKPGSNEKEAQAVQEMMQVSTSSMATKPVNELQPLESMKSNPDKPDDEPLKNQVEEEHYQASRQIAEPVNYTEEPVPVKIRKETMMIVPKRKEDYNRQPVPGAEINSLTGDRERRLRSPDDAIGTPKDDRRNNLRNMVSVASNDYKRVAFGGIRNLYLTVTNNSIYELDHVIVELQYLKPSEEPLRTENIRFKSIAPNASATIRVPDTNRGIKVNYRIINIESRASDLASGN